MPILDEPIVFIGSGPVAAASLRLLMQDFTIEAVITKPRPEGHKGSVPVLELCEAHNLPFYTATDKKSLDALFDSRPVKSRVAILIDFGIIVSQYVIDYFELGIINSHFSLLPEWRGADPITFSILSGQSKTGVSLMMLTAGMDEGPILAYGEYELSESVTTPELTDGLIKLSASLLVHMVPLYVSGEAVPSPQTEQGVSYSRKLSKADSVLDFAKPAIELEREIRAFIEWPRSRTTIGITDVIITKAHVIDGSGEVGKIWQQDKQLGFYTSDGILVIDELIPAGKKPMPSVAFLAGYPLS